MKHQPPLTVPPLLAVQLRKVAGKAHLAPQILLDAAVRECMRAYRSGPIARRVPRGDGVFYRGPSLLTGELIVGVMTGLDKTSLNPKTGPVVQTWILRPDMAPMDAVRENRDDAICGDCALRGDGGRDRRCYVPPWIVPNNVWRVLDRDELPELSWSELRAGVSGRSVRLGAYGDPAAIPFEVWDQFVDAAAGWIGYCVVPETKVLTSDLRWVCAGDLRVGDTLMAFDEFPNSYGRFWRKAVVTSAERVLRPCYAVHLRDGTTLVASDEHPWLVANERKGRHTWMRTDRLRAGSRPTKIVKVVNRWGDPTHSWDAGYLAGAFDGEGCIGRGSRAQRRGFMGHLGFTQLDNAMATTVSAALDIYRFAHHKSPRVGKVPEYQLQGGLREVMRFLGQIRPPRLLAKFNPDACGRLTAVDYVPVESVRFVGEREVAGLETTTGTFVAEGFASHNTHQWRRCDARFRAILMASVDTLDEFREAQRFGWRTFRVLPSTDTVLEHNECRCPASDEMQHRTTCERCQLCRGQSRPARSIAIVAHGHNGVMTAFYRSRHDVEAVS